MNNMLLFLFVFSSFFVFWRETDGLCDFCFLWLHLSLDNGDKFVWNTGLRCEVEQLDKQLDEQKSLHAILNAQIKRQVGFVISCFGEVHFPVDPFEMK